MEETKEKYAVFFPGIGYHKDKPLLYYSSRLLQTYGYQNHFIQYHDLPQKVKGDEEMMKKAFQIAVTQAVEQLEAVDFNRFKEIICVGKSIGTVVAAKYVEDFKIRARQIWYTPVERTFSFAGVDADKNIISFLGYADNWSDVERDKQMAEEKGIRQYMYPDSNHSLETDDVIKNIEIIRDVMDKTKGFIKKNI